jgi:glutaredoxin 3
MAKVVIYTTRYCGYCVRAKQLLKKKQVAYDEIPVDNDRKLRQEMTRKSGGYTVPQIFIDGQPIGGCDELYYLERTGKLDELLNA